jgi:AMIN domain
LSNPERVYLDFPKTEVNPGLITRQIAVQNGLIEQVRIGTSPGPMTRVVLDLAMPVRYRVSKVENQARMLIELNRPPEGLVLLESIQLSTEAPVQTPASVDSNSHGALPAGRAAPSVLQEGDAPRGSASGPQTYGNGEKAGLNYSGTTPLRNILMLGLNMGSEYNDNVLGSNQQRVGDVDFLIGPSLSLRREGTRLSLALSYQPNFRIYRKAFEPNAVDQALVFDGNYRVTSRFAFRARTSAFYTTGILQPSQNEEFLAGLVAPSSLNQTVFTPTARQLGISSRIDATYQPRAHDSIDLFLSQSTLDFKQQISSAGSLQNTIDRDAGLLYQHRLTRHITLGGNYLLQDIRFGANSRTRVHSAFFSYAQQLSRSVTVSVFGGPQYLHNHDLFLLPLGPSTLEIPINEATWHWAMGGTLTKQIDKSAFQLTAQHQVSNGGGLIGAVVSTSAGASLRQRLPGRWDAIWSGSYAKNSSLSSGTFASDYQSETAGIAFERPVTEKLSVRIGYDFLRQRGTGQSLLLGSFDRDLLSVQFSYRFHQIALGR